nr:response regulator transcription factor [Leucobacter chinensis]
MNVPLRALVVDDEASIRTLLELALRHEGFIVETAATGAEAIVKEAEFAPDVIVLDIMLPDFDGMQVLSKLRASGSEVPVVFLTAKTDVQDRVAGLTAGGDDYVVKPFSLEELSARLRAVVRRARRFGDPDDAVIRVGDLVLNEETYEVSRGGDPIELSTTEFELLRYLMRNPDRVLSKPQILDRVWSYDYEGKQTIVELYISYLRKKIDAGRDSMIRTVRGSGYMLRTPQGEG